MRPKALSTEKILALDADYRRLAEANKLRRIAPKCNNPGREAWLPVMKRKLPDGWATVLYSNTARAHQKGKTREWVVVYFKRGEEEERYTVVNEYRGRARGKRVVRGRESDCLEYYKSTGEIE